jgi:hypothetical protein
VYKLSETIERKFIETIDLSDWEIETDTGWTDIIQIQKTIEYDVYEIETESGLKLEGADTHILFDENMNEIFLQDTLNKNITTKNGNDKVIKLIKHDRKENMFDLTVSSENHRYYTNNILSHNTEVYRIFLTHYILFNEYKTILLFANKADTAREILGKLQVSYQHLPLWLQLSVKEFNKGSFSLENGSRIIAFSTADDAARGYTGHVICIDEMAFIENWEDFYASVYPVITAGKETKLVITSTPKGMNQFYDFWQGANFKDKEPSKWNGFHPFFVPWNEVPGRDESWKEATLRGLNFNYEKFDQEYGASFIGSSGTLVAGWALSLVNDAIKEPITTDSFLRFYEYPIKEKEEWKDDKLVKLPPNRYTIVCDVSRGKGLDYSAFSIFDITQMPYKQICTYRNNQIMPRDYADIVHNLAKFYNNAWILVEINDIGEQVGDIIMNELEYENLLCTESAGKGGKKIVFGGKRVDKGIRTTTGVKMSGCLILKMLIEQRKLDIYDENTVLELMCFTKDRNSYKAEQGKHDDLVMTLVLFSWLTDNVFFKDMTDINTFSNLREKTLEEIENEMLPLGYIQEVSIEKKYKFYTMTNTPYYSPDIYDSESFNPKIVANF